MHMILARHGEPARLKGQDAQDPPLTDRGHGQARQLGVRLQTEAPDVLVSSHLKRAQQTAEPTSSTLGKDVVLIPALAEVDADGADYVHVEDLRATGGETWAAFLRDPITTLGGDEAAFKARVLAGFEALLETYRDADRVAVFTHGFPINIILSHVLGLDEITRFLPAHGSITRLAGSHIDSLVVLSVNETGHFAAEGS